MLRCCEDQSLIWQDRARELGRSNGRALQDFYRECSLNRYTSFRDLQTDLVDRARLCRYRCCWFELGANPDRILGDRDEGRRAIPQGRLMEVSAVSLYASPFADQDRYFTRAISWARKYGIRILLDYHALPGSQNGWNHSGKSGQINWMTGVMGITNAQRHLESIRSLTQYISQPGIKEVVPM